MQDASWELFFQPPSLLIGKVLIPVMHFCACPIHYKVLWNKAMILQIDFEQSMLFWTVVRVNWLMLCQYCRRAVFLAVIAPPVRLGAFFNSGE